MIASLSGKAENVRATLSRELRSLQDSIAEPGAWAPRKQLTLSSALLYLYGVRGSTWGSEHIISQVLILTLGILSHL